MCWQFFGQRILRYFFSLRKFLSLTYIIENKKWKKYILFRVLYELFENISDARTESHAKFSPKIDFLVTLRGDDPIQWVKKKEFPVPFYGPVRGHKKVDFMDKACVEYIHIISKKNQKFRLKPTPEISVNVCRRVKVRNFRLTEKKITYIFA